jgi:hypothetical protein
MTMRNAVKPLVAVAGGLAAVAVAPSTPAFADSGVIYSGGGSDCAGRWMNSRGDEFALMDRAGGDDNDYCYVDYGGSPSLGKRLTIPEDSHIGEWQYRKADMAGVGKNSMYFKVCEERENDPDLCSSVHGPYTTGK